MTPKRPRLSRSPKAWALEATHTRSCACNALALRHSPVGGVATGLESNLKQMEIHENPQFKVNFHGESSILMGIFHGDLGASICFAALCRLPLGFWRHWCLISLYHAKHHRSVDDEDLAEAAQHWFVFAETNHKANCQEILQGLYRRKRALQPKIQ